jgi:hypothetical protein
VRGPKVDWTGTRTPSWKAEVPPMELIAGMSASGCQPAKQNVDEPIDKVTIYGCSVIRCG